MRFYAKCLFFQWVWETRNSVLKPNLIAYCFHPSECKIECTVCIRLLYSSALVSLFDRWNVTRYRCCSHRMCNDHSSIWRIKYVKVRNAIEPRRIDGRIRIFTHFHDERWQRPDHRHCCSDLNVGFPVHYSAHTVTYPMIWLEIWCVNQFSCGKSYSNGNVWCASTRHSVGGESRNVLSTFVCIYTSCNSTALFQPTLQPKKWAIVNFCSWRENGGWTYLCETG